MASVNKVFLIGRLGADPEIKYTQSGHPVANFRIATSEVWNDKNGEKQERTEWSRVVVWGKTAEHCGEYLRKGSQVHVEGRLQTREWDDKNSGQKRYQTEVVADRVTFLDSKKDRGGGGREPGADDGPSHGSLSDDDIPFAPEI